MKKCVAVIIALVIAGFWLMPVQRVNSQTELEMVEKEIRGLEALAGMCIGATITIVSPSPNATAEDLAAYKEKLEVIETCAANTKTRLDWLRKRLGELLSKLPSTTAPEENPERKKQREKIEEWEKRLADVEGKKKQIEAWLENLHKTVKPQQPPPGFKAENTSTGGLSITTFTTPLGRIIAHLPADMRAGDTISGSVVAEPNGQTEKEREKNLAALGGHVIILDPQASSAKASDAVVRLPVASSKNFAVNLPPRGSDGGAPTLRLAITQMNINEPPKEPALVILLQYARFGSINTDVLIDEKLDLPERLPRPKTPAPNDFNLPTIGQNGRSVEIKGPFDGDSRSTFLTIGGQPVILLAESPRSCIFKSPDQNLGPTEITLKENNVQAKGTYRNLGVRLSAPKTSLLKGETTTLTIEVSGLAGIKQDVPLHLDAQGVINMDGGNYQYLLIRPQDVKPDGRYNTTRTITGQQAGDFNVTATVIDRTRGPIIIPLVDKDYRVKKDGNAFVVNIENVKDPLKGEPVDGEQTLEYRCPQLSQLPYIKRLFLSKGRGETKTLCLMVTPRIIMSEEEGN